MALVDIGTGLVVYIMFSLFTGEPWNWIGIAIAVVCSVLPDWDFFPFVLLHKRIKRLYSHQQIGHFPAIYFLAVAIIGQITSTRTYYLWLALLSLGIHFVKDTAGRPEESLGIPWLWPLSRRRFLMQVKVQTTVPKFFLERQTRMSSESIWGKLKHLVAQRVFKMTPGEKIFVAFAITSTIAWYHISD